jgi:hypothetical protein
MTRKEERDKHLVELAMRNHVRDQLIGQNRHHIYVSVHSDNKDRYIATDVNDKILLVDAVDKKVIMHRDLGKLVKASEYEKKRYPTDDIIYEISRISEAITIVGLMGRHHLINKIQESPIYKDSFDVLRQVCNSFDNTNGYTSAFGKRANVPQTRCHEKLFLIMDGKCEPILQFWYKFNTLVVDSGDARGSKGDNLSAMAQKPRKWRRRAIDIMYNRIIFEDDRWMQSLKAAAFPKILWTCDDELIYIRENPTYLVDEKYECEILIYDMRKQSTLLSVDRWKKAIVHIPEGTSYAVYWAGECTNAARILNMN